MRKNTRNDLTFEQVSELLEYDPVTGIFLWKPRPIGGSFNTQYANKEAGHIMSKGHIFIWLHGKNYYAHRLAWLLVTGSWPINEVDHINGVKSDNSFVNLRESSRGQNEWNKPKNKKNTSGYKGVCKNDYGWQSQIRIGNGKRIYLGTFDTPEKAYEAYCAAAEKYHKEFSRVA
jgi:hypothetical protein